MAFFLRPLVANMLLVLLLWPQGGWATSQTPVVMALAAAPTTLDARFTTGGASSRLALFLSLPLVSLGEDFKPQPAAAEKFEWLDDKTLKFSLGDWTFVDGTPLRAQDVKAFYINMQAPETISPFKGQLENIDKIQVLNARTLQFHLKKTAPFVWELFTHPLMRPTQALFGLEPSLSPVGLGPYYVAKGSTLANLTFRLSPHWAGEKPASSVLKFKTVKDPLVRLLKVQRGEAHLLQNDMPAVFFDDARQKGKLRVKIKPSTNYTYLGFNFDDPHTGTLALREAIAYALDREEIIKKLLFNQAKKATSLLPEAHPAYWPAPFRAHNLEKARQLLDDAGFLPDENGVRLRLRFSVTSNPSTLLLVQAIAYQLKQVGIELKVNVSEWGTFYGNILKGNFQMYLLTWVGFFDGDIFRSIFHSQMAPPQGANRGRWANKKMDDLIETLWVTPGQHNVWLQKIQQLQHQALPYVPLWQRHNVALLHPTLKGFTMASDGRYDGLLTTFIEE